MSTITEQRLSGFYMIIILGLKIQNLNLVENVFNAFKKINKF